MSLCYLAAILVGVFSIVKGVIQGDQFDIAWGGGVAATATLLWVASSLY